MIPLTAYLTTLSFCILKIKTGSGKMFRDKLITNEKIKKGKRIGNGQFGEVYKGDIFS